MPDRRSQVDRSPRPPPPGRVLGRCSPGSAVEDPRWPAPTFRQLTFRRGAISAARFAPDGQSVIYSAAWGGSPASSSAPPRHARVDAAGSETRGSRGHAPRRGRGPAVHQRSPPDPGHRVDRRRPSAAGHGRCLECRLAPGRVAVPQSTGGPTVASRSNFRSERSSTPSRDRSGSPSLAPRRSRSPSWRFRASATLAGTSSCSTSRDTRSGYPGPGGHRRAGLVSRRLRSVVHGHASGLESRTPGRFAFRHERLVLRVPGRLRLHDVFPDGRVVLSQERSREKCEVRRLANRGSTTTPGSTSPTPPESRPMASSSLSPNGATAAERSTRSSSARRTDPHPSGSETAGRGTCLRMASGSSR